MEILPKILDLCNKIVLLNIPIYHYIKRSGSITELEFSLWKYQSIHIADDTLAFCKQKYPDLVPYAYYYRLDSLNKMYEEIVNSINRKSFWWKEFVIRVKICYGYCLYIRNKTVRNMYGKDLKNLTIRAFWELGSRINWSDSKRILWGWEIQMIGEVCLLVIYNHRYDANISKINRIYEGRFSKVYHVMPFYEGDEPNVITVYESSFCFEGYLAQALLQIPEEYSYYFYVADDIVLNPG